MYVSNMQIMFHILASKSSILNDFPFPLINSDIVSVKDWINCCMTVSQLSSSIAHKLIYI